MIAPDTAKLHNPAASRRATQAGQRTHAFATQLDRRRCLATAVAGAVLASTASHLAIARRAAIDLGNAPPGGLPDGFTLARTGRGAPGAWSVQDDSSVANGRVLAQTSTDPTDYRFPLAIYQRISAANVEVSVRFKAVSGRVDRAGGLVVRLADPDNYYVVRANALEDNVNFYRVVKGSRHEVHGTSVPVPSNVWHTLGLMAVGDRFTISFNGRTLFTATDRSFTAGGNIGLWTKADSVTRFDTLMVKVLA